MKKIILLAFGGLALVSCKKYDCVCSTDYYDSNGYYVGTTETTYTVKGRTVVQAELECDDYETYDSYCTIF